MLDPDKPILLRHLREKHPNLLSTTQTWTDMRRALEGTESPSVFANGCLPSSGLSEEPRVMLLAVHRAAHLGLYVNHREDDWLCRDEPMPVKNTLNDLIASKIRSRREELTNALAHNLNNHVSQQLEVCIHETEILARRLCEAFQAKDPHFDHLTFLDACGIEVTV